jgi:hypothetical protein
MPKSSAELFKKAAGVQLAAAKALEREQALEKKRLEKTEKRESKVKKSKPLCFK